MTLFTKQSSRKIDIVFALSLIILFVATSFTLVLIGAKQYRHITTTMTANYEDRTTASYLAEKIRQYDTQDALSISDLNGVPALSLTSQEGGHRYITHIYYYDGYLRELVVTENSVFSLSSGQKIIEMQGFTISFLNPSLLRMEVTDTTGNKSVLYFSIHTDSGKEAS